MDDLKLDSSAKTSNETSKNDKKKLRHKIKDQMEFYFSDSNLTKDRFLKNEIMSSSDGCWKITLF